MHHYIIILRALSGVFAELMIYGGVFVAHALQTVFVGSQSVAENDAALLDTLGYQWQHFGSLGRPKAM